jgi:hypothetical protein
VPRLLDRLADCLAQVLRQRRAQAGKLALVLSSENGAPQRVERELGRGTGAASALADHGRRLLATLFGDAFADISDTAVYTRVALRAGGLRPARPIQVALWDGRDRREHQRQARQVAIGRVAQHARVPLVHAVLVAPDEVLPEDRYCMQPISAA